jgi:hypothetical protein
LRYFFLPELRGLLARAGFHLLHTCSFPALNEPPSEATWNVACVARAICPEEQLS